MSKMAQAMQAFVDGREHLTRKQTKARGDRAYTEARAKCRAEVYARDGGCCVDCGRPLVLNPADAPSALQIAHIDEIVKRSQGGDATDPANCQTRCHACHARKHGLKVNGR